MGTVLRTTFSQCEKKNSTHWCSTSKLFSGLWLLTWINRARNEPESISEALESNSKSSKWLSPGRLKHGVPLVSLRLFDHLHVGDGRHGAGLRRQRHRAAAVATDQRRLVAVVARLRGDVLSPGRVVGRVAVVVGVRGSSGALKPMILRLIRLLLRKVGTTEVEVTLPISSNKSFTTAFSSAVDFSFSYRCSR